MYRQVVLPFVTLFLAVGLLLFGSGSLATLLAVKMTFEAFPTEVIGPVMAAYSVGFLAGTLLCGHIVERVGHIRSFAVFAALAAAAVLCHVLVVSPWVWGLLRAVTGLALSGLFMIVESWLNEQTRPELRGRVLSTYMAISFLGLGSSQFLLNAWSPAGPNLLVFIAALVCLSLIPVSLTRSPTPETVSPERFGLRKLYRISPLGVIGCLVAGLISGSFFALGPVYANGIGLSPARIGQFMGVAILGGFLLQWPVGHLSDHYDRRHAILVIALGLAAASATLVLVSPLSFWLVTGCSVLWGGLAFTLYPISLAHANDFIDARDLVATSSGLLTVYGLGLIAGPISASWLMGVLGPTGLFSASALAAAGLTGFALWRIRAGQVVPLEEQTAYATAAPTTTAVSAELDPRAEPEQHEFDFEAAAHAPAPHDPLFRTEDAAATLFGRIDHEADTRTTADEGERR